MCSYPCNANGAFKKKVRNTVGLHILPHLNLVTPSPSFFVRIQVSPINITEGVTGFSVGKK